VDEARRIIERLDRIEELKRAGAGPHALLGEVRRLLDEAESWIAAERKGFGVSPVPGHYEAEESLRRAETALAATRSVLDTAAPSEEVIAETEGAIAGR
jgi:hypothetical protein